MASSAWQIFIILLILQEFNIYDKTKQLVLCVWSLTLRFPLPKTANETRNVVKMKNGILNIKDEGIAQQLFLLIFYWKHLDSFIHLFMCLSLYTVSLLLILEKHIFYAPFRSKYIYYFCSFSPFFSFSSAIIQIGWDIMEDQDIIKPDICLTLYYCCFLSFHVIVGVQPSLFQFVK